jgi:hypothetical protein
MWFIGPHDYKKKGAVMTFSARLRAFLSKLILPALLLLAACGGGSSGSVNPNAVRYSTLNYPNSASGGSTLLTGIRGVENSTDVYITAIYEPPGGGMNGLLYQGPLKGGGTWLQLAYPSSPGVTVTSTALYGPDNNGPGSVVLVGNYTTAEQGDDVPIGLLYLGPPDGSGTWSTITPPGAAVTIAHSSNGGVVVGNYDTLKVVPTGKAFIYDISSGTFYDLVKPGAVSITAYGIWYNGGTSYTITGGYTDPAGSAGYLVDWDSSTHTASNWTSYSDPNQAGGANLLTHFEGITTDGAGGYNLASDQVDADSGVLTAAAIANVPRESSGVFGPATWRHIAYPKSSLTSANSVYQNSIIGIYQLGTDVSSGFVSTIPGF